MSRPQRASAALQAVPYGASPAAVKEVPLPASMTQAQPQRARALTSRRLLLRRLFGFGIGVHLIAGQPVARPKHLKSTRDDHLSFLCESLTEVEKRLRERKIEYLVDTVVEGGVKVQQVSGAAWRRGSR